MSVDYLFVVYCGRGWSGGGWRLAVRGAVSGWGGSW